MSVPDSQQCCFPCAVCGFREAFEEQWVRSVYLLSRIKQRDSTVCRLGQAEVQQLMGVFIG